MSPEPARETITIDRKLLVDAVAAVLAVSEALLTPLNDGSETTADLAHRVERIAWKLRDDVFGPFTAGDTESGHERAVVEVDARAYELAADMLERISVATQQASDFRDNARRIREAGTIEAT